MSTNDKPKAASPKIRTKDLKPRQSVKGGATTGLSNVMKKIDSTQESIVSNLK
jgi:hypothetical protein